MDSKDSHNLAARNDGLKTMIRYVKIVCILAGLQLVICCSNQADFIVSYKNPQIQYSGRIDTTRTDGAELYWSGTSIKVNFKGESIMALMKDESGDNYYNVIIDDTLVMMIQPKTVQKHLMLASGLEKGIHSVEIFKRTEWDRGKTTFYGFRIKGEWRTGE